MLLLNKLAPTLWAAGLCFALMLVGVESVAQERRIALVIGNGSYGTLPLLSNPVRDAEAIGQSLSGLGFTVFLATNLDQEKFRKAIRYFVSRTEDADTTLFYFAGHGATLGGQSYLFPTDFGKADIFDINEAIKLDDILLEIGSDLRNNLVFIDACRDNPLQSGEVEINTLFGQAKAARPKARIGTLISFATTPGHIAFDGENLHSPFTGALLDHLETPDLDVELMLKRVRRDVVVNSRGLQVPWVESSMLSTFYLAPSFGLNKPDRRRPNRPRAMRESSNPSLRFVLSNSGFGQKPILDKLSMGFSRITTRLGRLPAMKDTEASRRSARIKAMLCNVLEPPLPEQCNPQQ